MALGRMLGLPAPTTDYTVNRVHVPMRDGVRLVADHYAPHTPAPAGTLLVRGPYGRGFPFSLVYARLYAARGYHVVLQSVRGTFGSGGVVRADGQRGRRRRRHRGLAARAALVHRPVRDHRGVLPGIHPVGAAQGSAAGAGRGRHHRGTTRLRRLRLGYRRVHPQRLSGLVRPGRPPGGPRAHPGRPAPAAGSPQGGPGGRRAAAGCRGPGAARRGRTVVRVVGRTRRHGRSVLGCVALQRRRWTPCGCPCC